MENKSKGSLAEQRLHSNISWPAKIKNKKKSLEITGIAKAGRKENTRDM